MVAAENDMISQWPALPLQAVKKQNGKREKERDKTMHTEREGEDERKNESAHIHHRTAAYAYK